MHRFFKPFFKPPERGAEAKLYVALSPEVQDITGEHFVNKKTVPSSSKIEDENRAKRLWDVSLNDLMSR